MELATREGKRASGKAIEGLDLRRGGICLNGIDANEGAGREKDICKYRSASFIRSRLSWKFRGEIERPRTFYALTLIQCVYI